MVGSNLNFIAIIGKQTPSNLDIIIANQRANEAHNEINIVSTYGIVVECISFCLKAGIAK